MSRALRIVERVYASCFSPLALADDVCIDLGAGDWTARLRSPGGRLAVSIDPRPAPVDGTLTCALADLDRMLQGLVPIGPVDLRAGTRDVAPRKRQAHLVLVAAALGWAGRWPDPTADPGHNALVANALCDLAVGPCDATYHAAGLQIRATDTAAGCTVICDAGGHAVRMDITAREDRAAAFHLFARIASHVARTGPPQGDAWSGATRITFEPDPLFPRGWTLPAGRGGAWWARRRT